MKARHAFNVYGAAFGLGLKEVFQEPLSLLGSTLTYVTLVIAYGNLFLALSPQDLALHRLTSSLLVQYFAATEFVVFCCSFSHFKEIQNAIRNEDIHLALLRPCPVWVVYLGQWSGQSLGRFLSLAPTALALTGWMTSTFAPDAGTLAGIVVGLPMATLLLLSFNFAIGVSCLWFQHAEPIFWIWQKLLFFFGALLWPLALYPETLQVLAWLTPFPAILAAPAQWTLTNVTNAAKYGGYASQIVWTIACLALAAQASRALARRLQKGEA